ncbi:hypothetical protein BGZ70_005430 [Mortierella alpina]|uniref:FAD-binding PCMH-type domain-containing protein n=1 Tax=Mortierella alpina TaxID=64518 RepID=A0A9P6J8Y3_MORAP|nr:hypothetical protein BGZ70_005430 [Mortierella alpina]
MHIPSSVWSVVLVSLPWAAALLDTALGASSSSHHSHHRKCRCQPSQSCWPDDETWSAFNETVGGRLIATHPAAYECHDPHYDEAACSQIQKGYYHDWWRPSQPGAYQHANWEVQDDDGCLGFNRTAPCHQGNVPVYTVNATSVRDIRRAVRFASKHHIRLAVRNTGHDFLGRSTAASSLSIWVFYNKRIDFDDAFVPEGAEDDDVAGTGAIILGAGVTWAEAYKAADDHNVMVVGGTDATVGTSGGYCQGGGHSSLSPHFGLCVDNVLQYKVVTADGALKVANAFQNQDLFWALRGGGGGTFGVVVEATYKTHPEFDSILLATIVVVLGDEKDLSELTRRWFALLNDLSEGGWSGVTRIQSRSISMIYEVPNQDKEFARTALAPFVDYVQALNNTAIIILTHTFPSLWTAFEATVGSPLVRYIKTSGTNVRLSSRLIPQEHLQTLERSNELADAVMDANRLHRGHQPSVEVQLVAGRAVTKGTSEETSVHPAWRKALVNVIFVGKWNNDVSYEARQRIARRMTSSTDILRELLPESGAYFNEADPDEPDWQQAFFGSNYPRLKMIKDAVDPMGLFVCHKCVGSEDWTEDLMCPRTH